MEKLKACPMCGNVPSLQYLGGFYKIQGYPICSCCGNSYTEGHSSEWDMIKAWNRRAGGETE